MIAGWFAWRGSASPDADRASVVSRGEPVIGGPSLSSTSTGHSTSTKSLDAGRSAGIPGASGPAASGSIVVDVAGRVRRAGLVRLPAGARVADAIQAAGGTLAGVDLTPLNLAKVVTDGEQVVVGVASGSMPQLPPAGSGSSSGRGSSGSGPSGVVNLNTATLDQLQTLPGVGPVLAQRILDWRTAHGRFASVDDLRQVSGIGDRRYSDLAPLLRV